jgi:hypothetical protein
MQVVPAAVSDAAGRLSAISPAMQDAAGRVGGHAGAATGTPAEGAIGELVGRWAAVLPHFALSGETLSAAVATAAVAYAGVDASVADGAAIAGGGAAPR